MAKKRKSKITPEEVERFAETQRMVEERIAYHTAKAEEQERAGAEEAEKG
jgi:hypothetical protein